MRKILTLLLLIFPLVIWSCDDDETDGGSSPAPVLVSSMPIDGATDVTVSTNVLTLTFDSPIRLSKSLYLNEKEITILNLSVTGSVLTISSLPEDLERGKTYTLVVPQGALTSADGVSCEEYSITFTTEAKKESVISKTLVTENPLPATQKLFDFIVDNYGTKMISSSMANVAWNFDEAELVYKATGKYPAIATMDYIHLYTHRSDWDNPYWVVDYDVNDEVRDWVKNGGALAASWHWNVPVKEGVSYSGNGNVTCSPDKTTFMPSKMLVEGTWEKSVRDEDLAIMADYLLKLQEEGIALIWRPFHEASGNANVGGDAWFWWGREGAEVYKKIWIDMFEYFKAKGIRNLIWVWTTQTGYSWKDEVTIYPDEDWYPGDEYVDIVGRDEYNYGSAKKSADEFKAIQELFPNKIVTLSECGNVAKLSEQWQAGALWSWAMPWYQYNATTLDGHEHANTAWWIDAMNSEFIITRDEMPK